MLYLSPSTIWILNIYKNIFLQSVSVQELINNGYKKFRSVNSKSIENLRVMNRLKVVQSMEDGNEKNIVRSLVSDNYFSSDELMVIISIICIIN